MRKDSTRGIFECLKCNLTLPTTSEFEVKRAVVNHFLADHYRVWATKESKEPAIAGIEGKPGKRQGDIFCKKDGSVTWILEAKGHTPKNNPRINFNTGVGQLVKAERQSGIKYGFALPATPLFLDQCEQASDEVRDALPLYWVLVLPDGKTLCFVPPGKKIKDYWP